MTMTAALDTNQTTIEEIASPIELAKAYMASRPYKVARRQDLVLHNNATKIAPKLQMVPRVLKMDSQHQDLEADRQRTRTSYAISPLPFTQKALKNRISILEHDIGLGGPLQHVEKIDLKEKTRISEFWTSVPGRDSALAADIVATSTLPGVSITLALVEPPQKKCAFQMSAPEDDSFEIDDALAADIVATLTLLEVSLTLALVENNKQMFSEVVKVLERAEPKALELTRARLNIASTDTTTTIWLWDHFHPIFYLFSSPASFIDTSSSFDVSFITASNSTIGPATSIFWSTWDPERAYGFGTTYNNHMSTKTMKEDSMKTSTSVFDMSVESMVAEDTHVHGTDMSMDSMVAIDTHVHGTDMSVDNMVAKDTHIHGTDMSVVGMVAEGTHVHGTRATLNNYDHTHIDMMVEDCMQTLTGETSVASPLFSFDSGTQPLFFSYALHLDWWPT
nr:hypothetical protein [Tanacetum cinerariifolium]